MRILTFLMVLTASIFSQSPPPLETGVSQTLSVWRAARYSDVRYKLNLTLEKMSPVLKGHMEIRVRVSEPHVVTGGSGVDPIVLDWRKIRGHEKDSTIFNVTLNGKSLVNPPVTTGGSDTRADAYEERDEHLIFRDGVVAGENVIKLDFTSPILTSGSAITRYVDKEDGSEYIYSLFVPSDASTAFPVFDQPDLKARFTVNVDAPSEWRVMSNSQSSGLQVFGATHDPSWVPHTNSRFSETKPISTYVFAFAAGPWTQVSEPPEVSGGFASTVQRGLPNTADVGARGVRAGASPPSQLSVAGSTSADRGHSGPGLSESNSITDSQEGRLAPTLVDGALSGTVPRDPPVTTGGSDTRNQPSTRSVSSPRVSKGADEDSRAPSLTVGLLTPETSIYVRKSQAAKFQPHAAEVFRLTRAGIRYLETYFDYKFPWPKYDLS